jgi:hypothetical protein
LLFVVAHILADIMKRLGPATFIDELISVSTRPASRSHLLEALVRIDVIMLLLYTGLEPTSASCAVLDA